MTYFLWTMLMILGALIVAIIGLLVVMNRTERRPEIRDAKDACEYLASEEGMRIGKRAKAGDSLCKNIITTHLAYSQQPNDKNALALVKIVRRYCILRKGCEQMEMELIK